MPTTQRPASPQQAFQQLVTPYGIQPGVANELYCGARTSYGSLGATTAAQLRFQAIRQFEQRTTMEKQLKQTAFTAAVTTYKIEPWRAHELLNSHGLEGDVDPSTYMKLIRESAVVVAKGGENNG